MHIKQYGAGDHQPTSSLKQFRPSQRRRWSTDTVDSLDDELSISRHKSRAACFDGLRMRHQGRDHDHQSLTRTFITCLPGSNRSGFHLQQRKHGLSGGTIQYAQQLLRRRLPLLDQFPTVAPVFSMLRRREASCNLPCNPIDALRT